MHRMLMCLQQPWPSIIESGNGVWDSLLEVHRSISTSAEATPWELPKKSYKCLKVGEALIDSAVSLLGA